MMQPGKTARIMLSDDTVIFIETALDAAIGRKAIGAPTPEEVIGKFRSIADSICAVALDLQTALEKVSPTEAEIEFGVDAKVESSGLSALIVKGEGAANFKIKLKWVRSEPA